MIKPLSNHYAMENPTSVYDEEAMTALELAGRTTAKVNECVEACNQIPDTVVHTVQNHIDGGSFDKQIDKSLGDLEATVKATVEAEMEATRNATDKVIQDAQAGLRAQYSALDGRVNNLATLESGSTTGDAELMDGRTGSDGTVYNNIGASIRGQVVERIRNFPQLIFGDAWQTYLPNANEALPNTRYALQVIGNPISNMPSDFPTDGTNYTLETHGPIQFTQGEIYSWCKQYIFNERGRLVWERQNIHLLNSADNWTEWKRFSPEGVVTCPDMLFEAWEHVLTDADNALPGYRYMVQTNDEDGHPANLPTGYAGDCWLETTIPIQFSQGGRTYQQVRQTLTHIDTGIIKWWRHKNIGVNNDRWSAWKSSPIVTPVITVGATGCNHTKLTDALAEAYAGSGITVVVTPGTYDIIAELGDSIKSAGSGPKIGNGTHLYFQPGAKVKCHYNGGDANVERDFSPINAGNGDFTIENMVIDCSKVRYCVHDELNGSTLPGKHVYKGCDMKLNNVGSSWTSPQCIGGGLGTNTVIEITDCVFETADTGHFKGVICVSYHNSYKAYGESKITVTGCYFKGDGTIIFGKYGTSPSVTQCIVSGCSLGVAPWCDNEADMEITNNMALIAFNNEVRG